MSTEIQSGKPDAEARDPKIVRLGEEFYPFQLPRSDWHGYSPHLSLRPDIATKVILEDSFIPNLTFFTIAEAKNQKGRFWIEADKNQLGQLGLLKPSRYRPAVLGTPRWMGYHISDAEVLKSIQRLRAQVTLPDGEFEARPHIVRVVRGIDGMSANGIDFTEFRELHGDSRRARPLPVDSNDEEYLRSIKVKLVSK